MSEADVLPEVKQIVGGMLFATRQPVTPQQIRAVFPRVALQYGGMTEPFAEVTLKDIKAAIDAFRDDLEHAKLGFRVVEVAGGYKLQNDKVIGPWLRELLEKGKPNRLSKPALETLSIIAYRQPVTRAEIESIRGVSSDAIVRTLVDMQLIKVAGRSEQPGKPWLFGTSPLFLEYFGLKSLDELPGRAELKRSDPNPTLLPPESADVNGDAPAEGEPEPGTEPEPPDAPGTAETPEPV